jgi:chromosome partitioning protein
MSEALYSPQKAFHIFGQDLPWESFVAGGRLPPFARSGASGRRLKSWTLAQLPFVGEACGFLPRPRKAVCAAVFVSKGGVLKTSLTLNIARLAALHNLRTCVVGLDMQGDATTSLAVEPASGESCEGSEETWEQALERLNALVGLPDYFAGERELSEIIAPTDIPTLSYIPETPELVALDQSLVNRNRREHWLLEKVIEPLKERFDLVLLDCPPNWNRLIVNALVACDALISPLECKINNFRNFRAFQGLLAEFRAEMRVDFRHAYAPTRLTPGRKLSLEIYRWYRANLGSCAETAIRDSVLGEEASALRISLPEHAPTSAAAEEMRLLLRELWPAIAGEARPEPRPQPGGELAAGLRGQGLERPGAAGARLGSDHGDEASA